MDKINEIIEVAKLRPDYIRYGQAVFNEAYKQYPNEVKELWAGDFDCFHADSRVDIFLEKLKEKLL